MATQNYGHLIVATPVINASGGDYTAVDDATQQQYPLGGVYIFADSSSRPRTIKYVQYNPSTTATHGPIATLNPTPTAPGSGYTAADQGKVVAITSGGINGAVTIVTVAGGAVTVIAVAPAAAGQNFTVTTGLTTANAPSGGTGLTVAPATLVGWQQGSPLYYRDETRTVVSNYVPDAASYIASGWSSIWSFAGLQLNAVGPVVGDYTWIQISGFNDKVLMPASTVLGDFLVLTNANNTAPVDNVFGRVAGTAALTLHESVVAGVVITTVAAAAGGLGHGWIVTPLGGVL